MIRSPLARIVASATLLIAACTGNDSSPVGVEVLPGDVLGGLRVAVTTAFSRGLDFEIYPASRAQDDRLTTAHDWPTPQDFESRVVMRFDVTVLDSLAAGSTFTAPHLRLFFSEVDSDVTFTVHRVTNPWNEEAATWERRDFGQPWATAGGDFDPAPLARFTLTPLPADTVPGARPDSLRVPLPVDLFIGWRGGTIPNHGLILVQETAGEVVDFVSRGSGGINARGPTLEVEAQVPNGPVASLRLLAVEDIFLPLDRSQFSAEGIVVRGAEPPHRALVEPTLEDVPAGSTVASAALVFTIRAVDIPRDSLTIFALQPLTEFRGGSTIFAPLLTAVAGATLQTTAQPGDTVVFESPSLTRLVRLWLATPDLNLGIGLRMADAGPSSESLFFGGVQFHGLEAPENLRPRLRLLLVPSALPSGG